MKFLDCIGGGGRGKGSNGGNIADRTHNCNSYNAVPF